jgi:glycosyltransferase involved in cell wall biosynthesis
MSVDYTIVIPVYNKEERLYMALQSAFRQTLPPAAVLVIDDASTDCSMLQVEPFLNRAELKIIQMEQNVGISKVLNEALKRIDTPYFLQLDADDWLEAQAAERLVSVLHHDPLSAFAYGNHRLWKYDDQFQLIFVRDMIQPRFSDKYDLLLRLGYMVNPRCYRTEYVRAVGGWWTNDRWEGRYLEDARMIIRLAGQYSWIHIEEILHNVLLNAEKGRKKYPMYNTIRKQFYEEMLRRWGNEYHPVWRMSEAQVLYLHRLIPIY